MFVFVLISRYFITCKLQIRYKFIMDSQLAAKALNSFKKPFVPQKHTDIREFGSPRFTRKNNEPILQASTVGSRNRNHKQQQQIPHVCYISPKKVIDPQDASCSSFQSLKSVSNYWNKPTSDPETTQKLGYPHQNTDSTVGLKRNSFSDANKTVIESRQDQYNNLLKRQNIELKQIISKKNQQLDKITFKNSELRKKLENLNIILFEKNEINQRLSDALELSEKALENSRKALEAEKVSIERLQILIHNMENANEENNKINTSGDTEDDEKERFEKEINRYRNEVIAMSSKMKYFSIQESMLEKTKFNLYEEVQKNQRLKTQNRKLLRKVESLVRQAEAKVVNPKIVTRNPLKDSDISLELSPEK